MPDRPSSDVPEDGRDHGPLSSGPAPSPYDAKQLKPMKGRHRFRLRYVLDRCAPDCGPWMTRVNSDTGLTCSVPITDLAVRWDPAKSEELFDLIKKDDTKDITPQLCQASGGIQ